MVFDIEQILFSVFFSLKSSVNCLNKKDKIFAPMDDDRPCYNVNHSLIGCGFPSFLFLWQVCSICLPLLKSKSMAAQKKIVFLADMSAKLRGGGGAIHVR